ncbi:MAG: tyrosine-type recombinase/integrase, partial [Actinobacteria bacterium]|nr:tyrosine-type recombinase/integrase [Actinomycetota bacterium]
DSALIYMSGGDPHFLAETLTGTPVWKAIIKNWHSGGSLAGCSAGAIEMFRVAARTVGLKVGEGLHQLRHTCVSVLIAEGANPKEIQEWVGHASIEETMDTYGHLFPNAKHQLSGMLDNYAKKHSDNVPLSVAN